MDMVDQIEQDDAGEPAGDTVRRRILRRIAVASGVILAAILSIILLLDTGPGRRLVADQIRSLSFENGMVIQVGRIDGSLYGQMILHDLSVRDPEGEFLFSPEVHVDWRPFAYLLNHIDIRSATAQRIFLRRLPEFAETPPSDAPLLPDLDIDIGRLKVERFVIEKPVSGLERIGMIGANAHIADGRAQIHLDGRTSALVGAEGGDRLLLDLDAVPEEDRLAIEMELTAPKGGVIAAVSGMQGPIDLDLKGEGNWARWRGKLTAGSEGVNLANLDLEGRKGTFAIRGPTRFGQQFDEPIAGLLSSSTTVDLAVTFHKRKADLSGHIESDAFRLDTNGLVDLSENSFEDLQLRFVLIKPSVLAEGLQGDGLQAALTLDGAFATPKIEYSLNADRIVMAGAGLEGFKAKGSARIDAERISIPIAAGASRITGLDTAAGGGLENVRFGGDITIDGQRILSDNFRIHSNRIDAKFILLANMETGLYSGSIDGRVDDYRLESVGIFNLKTELDLQAPRKDEFVLAGRVRARSTRLTNDNVEEYLGGNIVAASDVRYSGDGTIKLANLQLDAPDLHIAGGEGSYSPDGSIYLAISGTSHRYGKIGVRVTGTIADPDARVTADRPGLGIGLANLEARVVGAERGYRLRLTGGTDYGPIQADVTLGTGGPATITVNSATLSGIDFAGSLQQTKNGPFAGRLTARGSGLGGVVRLSAQGRYQRADFNLRANNTVFQGPANISVGSAIMDGRAILFEQPDVVADVQLAETRIGSFNLTAGRIKIDYRNGQGKIKTLIEGTNGAPFRLAANASLEPELWRIMLDGKTRGIHFRTAAPARILPRTDLYALLPAQIDFGDGNIKLAGHYGEDIKIQSRLEGIDLALVNAFWPGAGLGGRATGSLDFVKTSPAAFPKAAARLNLRGFTRTTAASVSRPVDVNLFGNLSADGSEAKAVVRSGGTLIGRMSVTLRPLPPNAGPWLERILQAPLDGGIRYNGPAETVFSLAGEPGQNLTGSLGIAVDLTCSVEDPCMAGIVVGKKLTYVNEEYGTRLSNLEISGKFRSSRLEIERLTADAGVGKISGSGHIGLAGAAGYPMDLSLTLDQARLARSDALSASATGQLRLTRSKGQGALLSGQIRLPEARYKIVREGVAQVPQLTGVRFKPVKGRKRITGEEVAEPITSVLDLVRLDVDVKATEKLYVSGMGLESEWRADFNVSGTSQEPRMTGAVRLIRGTLGFAGRSFELTRGDVEFTGGRTVDPRIRIVATEDVEDIAVNVNITGQASNPQIAFSSTPSLPQDEIMSRILFGSSIANLSPIQAVQLATSLNSLRGSGGGLNPLGKLRSASGIDRLRILGADEATGRGTAFAAGQYLTDDIYVELITDTRGFTATQLEIAITSWLSVLSQTGGSGASSANIRIKKDY